MEEGRDVAEDVLGCETHCVSDEDTVIHQVAMRKLVHWYKRYPSICGLWMNLQKQL